jgi:heme-degrading monooxygenase HmoA
MVVFSAARLCKDVRPASDPLNLLFLLTNAVSRNTSRAFFPDIIRARFMVIRRQEIFPVGGTMSTKSNPSDARFARIWRGRTLRERADEYERYWLAHGSSPLKLRGALAVHMLRDDGNFETEFVTISYWASLEAMTGSEVGDPTDTHHLERDPEFLMELPKKVQVLRLLEAD